MTGMQDTFPKPVPGSDLAALRKSLGVQQQVLADQLKVHRITLRGWERSPEVDPIRAAKYQRALREIVAAAITDSVA